NQTPGKLTVMAILGTVVALVAAVLAAAQGAAAATCTVSAVAGFSSCSGSSSVLIKGPFTVPAETVATLSVASGGKATVTGTVTFAKSTSLTKSDYLFTLQGSGVTFDGTSGVFNGNGASYWDGEGSNGGVNKPKMFKVSTSGNSVIKGIKLLNTPIHAFSISGSNNLIESVTLDNSAGTSLGHNTDAFDVSASNIIIKNSYVYNQDDCLAVNSGSNITFSGNYCSGGHGISIGSIASDKTVDGVYVSGCTIVDSQNGVRIKTVYDATGGYVKNVQYSSITLSGITKYGIVIEQDYENGSPTGTPTGGIPISGVTLSGITGTMASGYKYSTYILCAACSDFTFSGISITPKKASCTGISPTPSGC
ncbi:hypothetical protein HK405_008575, partial [Cladochytrium tenue]